MKAFVFGLVKSLVLFIVVCLLLEVSLRLFSGYSSKIRFFTSSPYQQPYLSTIFSWNDLLKQFCCQQPGDMINGYRVNTHGYLSPDVSYTKPAGTKRLVIIGDSQAVGVVPYQNNFIRLMESQMQSASQSAFQVINLGVIGAGPLMEEKVLAMEGIRYQPDVVMLVFFVGNDFYDDLVYKERYKNMKHRLPLWVYQSRLFSFLRNSIRFRLLNTFSSYVTSQTSPARQPNTDKATPSAQVFSQDEYLYLERQRADILYKESPLYDHFDEIKASIIRMKSLSESAGAPFVVLIIPDEFQLNADLLNDVIGSKNGQVNSSVFDRMAQYVYLSGKENTYRDSGIYDIELPQKKLTEFFISNNIQHIDPLTAWIASQDRENYFALRNTHLNIFGNKAIADMITPIIEGIIYSK